MAFASGTQLGCYRIAAKIGSGGMGDVYRATDERLGRDVAIKFLHPDIASDPAGQRRFAMESRAASALNHPNILTVYDVGADDEGVPYIVTEFLQGESLDAMIARGPMTVRKALEIGVQIAAGIVAAHEAGLVHRDLKPSNLMVVAAGRVKILDFGLAKPYARRAAAAAPAGETPPGFIIGTAAYMSPEQVRADELDHRSDQFSFGAVLYEMLTGSLPFSGPSSVSTMAAILHQPPRPIADVNPTVPAPLRWCIERCLEKDPDRRYASTADLQRELEVLLAHLEDMRAVPDAVAVTKPLRRRMSALWTVAAAVVGLAAGAVLVDSFAIPPAAVDLARYRLEPLATPGSMASSPAWSSDGASIAYTAVFNGVRQVFVHDLKSPTPAQLTTTAADCERPFWAAGGSRIFYFSGGTAESDLYSVGTTGGAPELVVQNASAAAMAPDGKTLYFLRTDRTGKEPLSLWSLQPGTAPRPITGAPFDSPLLQSGYLSFSSTAHLGLWLGRWDGKSEFWTLAWPSGPVRQSFTMAGNAYPFAWVPGSQNIVFGGMIQGSTGADLQLTNTENGRSRRLFEMTVNAGEAAVSPDGRRVAFVASGDNFDLISVPLDGSPVDTLLGTNRNEFDPSWAPSGGQFAYVTDRTGHPQIWVRGRRDGWDRPVVTERDFGKAWIAEFSEPNFSPDGRRLSYSVSGSTGHTIHMSSIAGGNPVRLSSDTADESSPSWNADGTWIAYLRNVGGKWSLVKAPSGGGSSPTVLRDACLPSHPRWNRRGKWIACITNDGLTVISDDGKESRALSRDHWLTYGWSADGALIYGVKELDGRRFVSSIDVETGAGKDLGELQLPRGSELRGYSLAADGKSFATSASHPNGDIWILEGFERPGLASFWPRQ